METILKEYEEHHGKTYECSLYYNLGGYSYFTNREEERGYYISVLPVEVSDSFVKYEAFTGYKYLLVPVKRKSKRAETEAEQKYHKVKACLLTILKNERIAV